MEKNNKSGDFIVIFSNSWFFQAAVFEQSVLCEEGSLFKTSTFFTLLVSKVGFWYEFEETNQQSSFQNLVKQENIS